MLKNSIYTTLFLIVSIWATAQQGVPVNMSVRPDQNVYVCGEDIWLEGDITTAALTPKSVQVQLLDRKGQVKAEVRLLHIQGKFSGSMEVPTDLISDYYFLDTYVPGLASSVEMRPLLVINPKIPPATCSVSPQQSAADQLQTLQKVGLDTDKDTYTRREKVVVNSKGLPVNANYTVIVKRYDLLAEFADSVSSSFHLQSEHPAMGEFETEGNIINARVRSSIEGAPKKGIRLFASVMGDQAKITSGVSDDEGRVRLILPFIYGETQVVFSIEGSNDQRYRIEMEEDSTIHPPIDFPCLNLTERMRTAIEERVLSYRSQKGYFGGPLKKYTILASDTTDFYGKPDHFYALDNYVRFPDMKEILLEFVPEVRVRNGETNSPVLQVLDEPFKSYFETNGLVMLDGIPIQDMKALMAFDPLLVKSIDVMSRKYYLGDTLFNGVVHYKTYKGDLAGFTLPERDIIYPYSGIQIPAAPDFRNYDNKTFDPQPNLRNLLYFDNSTQANSDGRQVIRFFTSDADGRYKIVLSGKDQNGVSFYGEKIIDIE
ncbi:hypothetical protein [Flavihumibacter fluvii]|uniref:hypothetical protein n=1 Tax=Flavihumibacter fluvii TaxID=2838157 RepID=UPI001BDEB6CD|nr:hypothetical protein [Flavihumibacter fluvii]ULQ51307.1 hypothetical protein KJS93_14545 [Flavihumibacter fluvii]